MTRAYCSLKGYVRCRQDGGELAVLQAYHATLVPPMCLAAAKLFFDQD